MTSAIPHPIVLRSRSAPLSIFVSCSSAARAASRPQALIIEDCRFIGERVARALEAKGFDCTVVADGFAGLGLLRARRFDLFVLDVDMPIVDGFTVLRELRSDAVHAHSPVLMLTADDSEADHDRARELGANGTMSKPLQLRPLNAIIDSMMS